jgi:hypothetical protein
MGKVMALHKDISIPEKYALFQNYPNPFNPETEIRYEIPEPNYLTLKIFNALGHEIRILVDEEKQPGSYIVRWDGKDNFGKPVSSGLYFYTLRAGEFSETRKALLLR